MNASRRVLYRWGLLRKNRHMHPEILIRASSWVQAEAAASWRILSPLHGCITQPAYVSPPHFCSPVWMWSGCRVRLRHIVKADLASPWICIDFHSPASAFHLWSCAMQPCSPLHLHHATQFLPSTVHPSKHTTEWLMNALSGWLLARTSPLAPVKTVKRWL